MPDNLTIYGQAPGIVDVLANDLDPAAPSSASAPRRRCRRAAPGARRCRAASHAARSAGERIGLRLEAARAAAATLEERARREARAAALREEPPPTRRRRRGRADRRARGGARQLAEDRAERLERELAELEQRRAAAAAEVARLAGEADAADAAPPRGRRRGRGRARRAPRGSRRRPRPPAARPRAPAPSWRSSTSSCARTPARPAAPRRWPTACSAEPGYELALAAALGPRLRAAVAADVAEGDALLDRAGRDGGAALVAPADGDSARRGRPAPAARPPRAGALLDRVRPRRRPTAAARRARCSPTSGWSTSVEGAGSRVHRRRGDPRRPRLVGRDARAAPGPRRRRGPRARRAQPPRRARGRGRARRAGRAGGAGPRRGRDPRRPAADEGRDEAERAARAAAAPATRPPRPSGTPAG